MNIKICDIISKILIVVGVITLTGIVNEVEQVAPSFMKIFVNLFVSSTAIFCGTKICGRAKEVREDN
jgi:hypothetical protein